MGRRTRTLLLAGALVLTLGIAAPAQAAADHPVPIKGTLVGAETIYPGAGTWEALPYWLGPATEFDIDGDGQTDYTCSEPAHELVVGTLTGNVSHLGRVTRQMSYCAVWDGMGGYGMFDFSQVLIAANGDTLILGQGPFSSEGDDPVDFTAETPIAGGTGRFLGAEGTLYETGRMHASWWPPGFVDGMAEGSAPWVKAMSLTYTGEITYDASNRAAK